MLPRFWAPSPFNDPPCNPSRRPRRTTGATSLTRTTLGASESTCSYLLPPASSLNTAAHAPFHTSSLSTSPSSSPTSPWWSHSLPSLPSQAHLPSTPHPYPSSFPTRSYAKGAAAAKPAAAAAPAGPKRVRTSWTKIYSCRNDRLRHTHEQIWPTLKLTEPELAMFRRNSRAQLVELGRPLSLRAKYRLGLMAEQLPREAEAAEGSGVGGEAAGGELVPGGAQVKVPYAQARSLLHENSLHLEALGENPRWAWGCGCASAGAAAVLLLVCKCTLTRLKKAPVPFGPFPLQLHLPAFLAVLLLPHTPTYTHRLRPTLPTLPTAYPARYLRLRRVGSSFAVKLQNLRKIRLLLGFQRRRYVQGMYHHALGASGSHRMWKLVCAMEAKLPMFATRMGLAEDVTGAVKATKNDKLYVNGRQPAMPYMGYLVPGDVVSPAAGAAVHFHKRITRSMGPELIAEAERAFMGVGLGLGGGARAGGEGQEKRRGQRQLAARG